MHAVNVTPEVTGFDEEGYSVVLRGTAGLGSGARGWFKTRVAWWCSAPAPGEDILLDVPKATRGPATETVFDAALYWAERGPGRAEPLWTGRYRIRNTWCGPILEEA